jgi:predicted AlkP superfamily phosphohydrolase/phosphomutase
VNSKNLLYKWHDSIGNCGDEMRKVLLIGIDGATLEVIQPMIQKGFLPNINKLITSGYAGILNSSMPPISPVAWTSMVTGVNPGKHGIFDFMERDHAFNEEYRVKFICGGNRRSEAIWSYLDRKGSKSIVMNVPMTYPPDQISGVMVSGMDTPSKSENYAYPQEIKELLNINGKYITEVPIDKDLRNNPATLFARYLEGDDRMVTAALSLMDSIKWDFFMIVFTSLDRSQHFFTRDWDWNNIDLKMDENTVLRMYGEMDRYVGLLTEKAGQEVTTLIVSDHGFGYAPRAFSLNQWLISKGYMVVKDSIWQKIADKNSKIAEVAHRTARKFFGESTGAEEKQDSMVLMTNLDWSKTSVYSEGGAPKLIINRQAIKNEDEFVRLKEQIVSELKGLKDPESGESIFRRVEKKEDIYKGPLTKEAADIILEFNRGYVFKHFGMENFEFITEKKNFIEHVGCPSGEHLAEGILIASGPAIKKMGASIQQSEIIDIAPTVLYLLGQEIPSEMDGKMLDFMIKNEFITDNTLKFNDENISRSDKYLINEEEAKIIEERLKSLGYL